MKWVTIMVLTLWYTPGGLVKGVGLFMNMWWGSEFWLHYPIRSLDSNYA